MVELIYRNRKAYRNYGVRPSRMIQTAKAICINKVWIPRSQVIFVNKYVFVAEWMYEQKMKESYQVELQKINEMIEAEKKALKETIHNRDNPDPYSVLTKEDYERHIQDHIDDLKKLSQRKEYWKKILN